MSAPLGRRDFFALEAGEYLERLARFATGPAAPDSETLVRTTRALRGAALMAGPPGYAVTASALESLAKALRDGAVSWSPRVAEELSQAIETAGALLRRVRDWGEEEIARSERTAARLNDLAGSTQRRDPFAEPRAAPTQSAAVRAYVARETAALAATLEQAADAVDQHSPDSLASVAQRLQPLRGLGALPGLSPLPELLEALDLTLSLPGAAAAWPPGAGRAFRATATALARMARDIAELGSIQQDSAEITRAAELLREAFADEADVVAVARLFRDGDGAGIVRRGTPPGARPVGSDVTVELISLGDRLRHGAAILQGGPGGAVRALQLHALVASLRGVSLSPLVDGTAGELVRLLDRAVMSGRAGEAEPLAGALERAARILIDAAESGRIGDLGASLGPCLDLLEPVVPIESLAPAYEPEPVPIASLAPEPEEAVVAIESLGYDRAPAYSAFEQSFATYHRLGRGAGGPAAVAEPEAVAIESLLYRGRRALERADLVRRELNVALRAEPQLPGVQALLGELLDLVPLALADDR